MGRILKQKKLYIGLFVIIYLCFFALSVVFADDTSYFDVNPAGEAENTHGFDLNPKKYDQNDALDEINDAGAHQEGEYAFGSPEWYFSSIVNFSTNPKATKLDSSLEKFNSKINAVVSSISDTVCKPVGYIILTLFALFEIFNIMTARDALKGEAVLYSFFRMLIRVSIAKILVDNSKTILYALFDISLKLILKTSELFTGDPTTLSSIDSFMDELGSLSTFERLSASAVLLVVWLCVVGANVLCRVIITGRFITIYMLVALAPIPLATFSNEAQSEIGKSFLKRFFAECLQGFILYLAINLFPYILNSINDAGTMTDMTGWLIASVVNALVLIAVVMGTNSLAKNVVNVI